MDEDGYATPESLAGPRPAVADSEDNHVIIPGVGKVKLKGMTRWEMVEVGKLEGDRQKQDNLAIFYGTERPKCSQDQIMAWRKAGWCMELEEAARKINALSGIGKDAAKSNVSGDGAGPVD